MLRVKTKTYKLYAASTTSANALASVIIQRDGYIHGISGQMHIDNVVDNHYVIAELSFNSVAQATTNDTIGPICEMREFHNVGAAGSFRSGTGLSLGGLGIPVKAGDRLYLHTTSTVVNSYISYYVYVAE